MRIRIFIFLLISGALFTACHPDDETEPVADNQYVYQPVLMDINVLRASVKSESPKTLTTPGKIVYKSPYIFIVEKYEGIHVVDNTDPANPQNISFIRVPGCVDLAIKENVLYTDNAIDLVAVDISNINSVSVLKRIESIFPELNAPNLGYIPYYANKYNRPANTVIVGWTIK